MKNSVADPSPARDRARELRSEPARKIAARMTSVDLPIVSKIVEASEETPCLAMSLKLEMPVIRELLGREEIQVAEALSDSLPWRQVKSRWIQREILYLNLRGPEGARLRAIATLRDRSHRTA